MKFSRTKHMVLSDAPLWLIFRRFRLKYLHKLSPVRAQMKKEQHLFREFSKGLKLDHDWFTGNIPTWLMAFRKNNYSRTSELNCMEIGSWQGLSAVFVLHYFSNAKLTCVDTWAGADEHKSGSAAAPETLLNIEEIFNLNLFNYKDRLTKYRGTSYQFFNYNFQRDRFDLIYVDGSHHADDVLVDAIKAFEMLKVNGLMIFDDYFWDYYTRTIDNPSGAINAFIRLKHKQLEVICFDHQLVVKKISTSIRWVE